MLCPHCHSVHNERFECDKIKKLKEFCGDTEYQRQQELKRKKHEKKNS